MKVRIDTTPASDTHAFSLDDETLLFQAGSGRILRLNPTASVIWQGLSAGVSIADIVSVLVDSTGGRSDSIAADIDHLITQWNEFGLFQGTASASMQVRGPDTAFDQPLEYESNETIRPGPALRPTFGFRVIDTDFLLEMPDPDVLALVVPLLSHLEIIEPGKRFIRFAAVRTTHRYVLLKDGVPIDWCPEKNGIAPMIHANALMTAYDEANCLIGIHAAAMELHGKCILLPALSGSGKSTLTAALAGSGFRYLADDLVLLTESPVRMRPVPVAIGLKKGAWSLLSARLPEVAALATHLRADGKLVRYFVPHNGFTNHPDYQPRPVHAVVFPNYVENEPLTLKEIKRAEALCRIAEAGYDAHHGLSADVVKQLVQWIAGTPSFELNFSSLEQAARALQTVIG